MKPKLTKAQLANAKRAALDHVARPLATGVLDLSLGGSRWRHCGDPEWSEVERLLRVALRAVRGA